MYFIILCAFTCEAYIIDHLHRLYGKHGGDKVLLVSKVLLGYTYCLSLTARPSQGSIAGINWQDAGVV